MLPSAEAKPRSAGADGLLLVGFAAWVWIVSARISTTDRDWEHFVRSDWQSLAFGVFPASAAIVVALLLRGAMSAPGLDRAGGAERAPGHRSPWLAWLRAVLVLTWCTWLSYIGRTSCGELSQAWGAIVVLLALMALPVAVLLLRDLPLRRRTGALAVVLVLAVVLAEAAAGVEEDRFVRRCRAGSEGVVLESRRGYGSNWMLCVRGLDGSDSLHCGDSAATDAAKAFALHLAMMDGLGSVPKLANDMGKDRARGVLAQLSSRNPAVLVDGDGRVCVKGSTRFERESACTGQTLDLHDLSLSDGWSHGASWLPHDLAAVIDGMHFEPTALVVTWHVPGEDARTTSIPWVSGTSPPSGTFE